MNAQKGKDIRCGDHPGNALGGTLSGEIEAEPADGSDLLKRLVLRLVVEEVGGGEGPLLQTGLGFPEPDELVGLGIGQCPQEDRVDDAEDSGVRADTQSQRKDGDGGESTALEQHAEAKLDVLAEIRHGTLLFAGLDDGMAQKSGAPHRSRLQSRCADTWAAALTV